MVFPAAKNKEGNRETYLFQTQPGRAIGLRGLFPLNRSLPEIAYNFASRKFVVEKPGRRKTA
jgi:hypothetical protein